MTTRREDCPGADRPPRTGRAEARALWPWDSPAILGGAMREGGEALAGAEAFAGFALHHDEHLRPLLQGR
jgi:hypothetical protein